MMLHPSYTELIEVANENVLEGEEPVVRSRYSIIHAAAKRAHQLVDGAAPMIDEQDIKPLSLAIKELAEGEVRIMPQDIPSVTMGEAMYDAGILGVSSTELIGGEPMIIDSSELVGGPDYTNLSVDEEEDEEE